MRVENKSSVAVDHALLFLHHVVDMDTTVNITSVTDQQQQQHKLDCIDVFSGIGGISLALHDFTHTIQYVEWDSFCQQVLIERMEDGRLDRAPIHSDIKNLHISHRLQPQMLCGGFPCQDISSMGLQKGISDGAKSSMFYHMMRIVDECPSIQVVFLENVANIVNCGMKEVVDECTKRGFNIQWKVFTASEMGAPHVRARWFCLAVKPGFDLSTLDLQSKVQNHWLQEPTRRVTYKTSFKEDETFDPNWIQRSHTLGNTVVPHVVREAFVDLAKSSTKWHMVADCMAQFSMPVASLEYPYPESGLIYGGVFYSMPKRIPFAFHHGVGITMNDGDVKLCHLPTPRRGLTHPSSTTERSFRDLPTILVHCDQTKEWLKEQGTYDPAVNPHSMLFPNVNYVEWMMGYELDWTRVQRWVGGKQRYVVTHAVDAAEDEEVLQEGGAPLNGNNGNKLKKSRKPRASRHNGLHMLMKQEQYQGKDIKFIASVWRSLTDEERKHYSDQAKALSSPPPKEEQQEEKNTSI